MKKLSAALLLLLCTGSTSAFAQFRTEGSPVPTLNTADAMKGDDSFFSRLLDPARFSMHQTYSMGVSSSSFGSYGISMFTNTFQYKASDDIVIAADVSAVYSPFSSFGNKGYSDQFSKSVNGIYLTNARLDWKLGESTYLRVAYSGGPSNGFYGGYSPSFFDEFSSPSQSRFSGSKTVFGQVTK